MPKRKRASSDEDDHKGDSVGGPLPSLEFARLQRQTEIGQKVLHDALKLARGFERQKLGRRQRTAKTNSDDAGTTRLIAEVQALKRLDLEATAKSQLHKQLMKVKRIQEDPTFQAYILKHSSLITVRLDDTAATVVARLINSNPIKAVLPRTIDKIREILGIEKVEKVSGKGHTNGKPREKAGQQVSSNTGAAGIKRTTGLDKSDISEWEGFSAQEDAQISNDSESEEDFYVYDDMVASSGSDTEDDGGAVLPMRLKKQELKYDYDEDLSLSNSESGGSSEESIPDSKTKARKQKMPANTTFLPSLMGGYWSGSDSGELEDTSLPRPKKNRMGQQARRALWEKKYGDKANHVQKQARDTGWDPRKGAVNGDQRGKRGWGRDQEWNGRSEKHGRRGEVTGSNMDPVKPRRPKSTEPEGKLHPSWEAAKKAKEQKTTTTFQGKKITF